MPEDYTNRELGIIITNFEKTTTESLTRIETQVNRTNGRVKSLELWRMLLTGGYVVFMLLMGVFAFLLTKAIDNYDKQVDIKINTALQQYEDKNFVKNQLIKE